MIDTGVLQRDECSCIFECVRVIYNFKNLFVTVKLQYIVVNGLFDILFLFFSIQF